MAETSYYCFMTDIGKELQAKAHELGAKVVLDTISVGDGGGTIPTPTGKETALVNQVWSTGIGTKAIDEENKNIVWLKITIPADAGDFWIREFGVWAQAINDDGTLDPDKKVLFAYGNHAEYYKTLPIAGQSVTHELSVPIIVSNTADVTIKISEVGYATKTQWFQSNETVNAINKMYQFEITAEDVLNSGDLLSFPNGNTYPVGQNNLELYADGVLLIKNTDYAEPITSDATANTVSVLHRFPKGTVFHATIHGFTTAGDLPTVDNDVPSSEGTSSDNTTA